MVRKWKWSLLAERRYTPALAPTSGGYYSILNSTTRNEVNTTEDTTIYCTIRYHVMASTCTDLKPRVRKVAIGCYPGSGQHQLQHSCRALTAMCADARSTDEREDRTCFCAVGVVFS